MNLKMSNKDSISNLIKYVPNRFCFLCMASFEERCLSIARNIDDERVSQVYVLCNQSKDTSELKGKNKDTLLSLFKNKSEEVPFRMKNSVSIVEAVVFIIRKVISEDEKNLVVDISTFTHEILLILIKALYEKKEYFNTILFAYNGAKEYSVGDTPENMWLSKGCKLIRNVYGYPGTSRITRKNHLIVLTGFELERATKLIEAINPDYLTLGDGVEPTEDEHSEPMKFFKEKFHEWKNSFPTMKTDNFAFSCRDVSKTVESIQSIISKDSDRNYIVVPLNTKLSTLAVGIVALRDPAIQVYYSIPEIYNYSAYSSPSGNVSIVDVMELFDDV